MGEPHQSRFDGSLQRTGYYLRNLKSMIIMFGIFGKYVRREKCEEKGSKTSQKGEKRSFGRKRKRKRGDVENDLKEMGVKGLQNSWELIRLEINAEGD
jgi:hypothetical protein